MTSFIETWDPTKPAGSRDRSLGDDDIREFKRAIQERLNEDHVHPSDETGSTTVGYHRKCTLIKQGSNATAVTDTIILFCKSDGTTDELFTIDESGNVIQITKAGKLYLDGGRLSNNTNLVARNAANGADVNLIKANASDKVEIPDGAVMASSAAPTVDAGIANKKYVDDSIEILGKVKFTGTGTPSIDSSYNVSSITDNGTGDYTINWTNAFADANYVVAVVCRRASGGIYLVAVLSQTTTALRILCKNESFVAEDPDSIYVIAV